MSINKDCHCNKIENNTAATDLRQMSSLARIVQSSNVDDLNKVLTPNRTSNLSYFNNNFNKFIKYARNIQKDLRSELMADSEKPSQSSTSSDSGDTISSDDLPPVWNDELYESYVRTVVDECFSENCRHSLGEKQKIPKRVFVSKRNKETPIKSKAFVSENLSKVNDSINVSILTKSEEIQVSDSDYENNFVAKWNPVNSNNLKNERIPLCKRAKATENVKASTVSTPCSKAKVRSSIASSNSVNSRRSPSKLPIVTRFLGPPRTAPVDFSQDHPNLALENTEDDSLFPTRKSKSPEKLNQITEDKEQDESTSVSSDSEKLKAPNDINKIKTWHDILSDNKEKSDTEKIFDKEVPTRKTKVPDKKLDPKKSTEVIYDSPNKLELVSDKLNRLENLEMKHFPILCIRGEPKIQKVVEISIEGQQENQNTDKAGINNENVQCLYITHESIKQNGEKNKSNVVQEVKKHQEEKVNIEEKCDAMCQTMANDDLKNTVDKTKSTMAPLSPSPLDFSSNDSIISVHHNSLLHSTYNDSEFSSQTDDKKFETLKQHTNEVQKCSKNASKRRGNKDADNKPDTSNGSFKLNELMESILHVSTNDIGVETEGENSFECKPHMTSIGLDCEDLNEKRECFVQTEKLMVNDESNSIENLLKSSNIKEAIFERIKGDEMQNLEIYKSLYASHMSYLRNKDKSAERSNNAETKLIDGQIENGNVNTSIINSDQNPIIKANNYGAVENDDVLNKKSSETMPLDSQRSRNDKDKCPVSPTSLTSLSSASSSRMRNSIKSFLENNLMELKIDLSSKSINSEDALLTDKYQNKKEKRISQINKIELKENSILKQQEDVHLEDEFLKLPLTSSLKQCYNPCVQRAVKKLLESLNNMNSVQQSRITGRELRKCKNEGFVFEANNTDSINSSIMDTLSLLNSTANHNKSEGECNEMNSIMIPSKVKTVEDISKYRIQTLSCCLPAKIILDSDSQPNSNHSEGEILSLGEV